MATKGCRLRQRLELVPVVVPFGLTWSYFTKGYKGIAAETEAKDPVVGGPRFFLRFGSRSKAWSKPWSRSHCALFIFCIVLRKMSSIGTIQSQSDLGLPHPKERNFCPTATRPTLDSLWVCPEFGKNISVCCFLFSNIFRKVFWF